MVKLSLKIMGNSGLSWISSGRRYVLAIGMLLLVSALVVSKLILPSYQGYAKLLAEYRQKNQLKIKIESKLNELQTIDSSEIAAIAESFLMAVPSANKYLEVYNGIKSIADSSGVGITGFKIEPGVIYDLGKQDKQKVAHNQINVVLTVYGNLQAIRQMISGVQNILPITNVSKIVFSDNRTASASAIIQQSMEVEVTFASYWQELPSLLSKYETPIEKLDRVDYEIYEKLKNYRSSGFDFEPSGSLEFPGKIGRDNPFPI